MADSKDRELEGIDSDGERTELDEDDILGQEDPESVNNDLQNETLKNLYKSIDNRNLEVREVFVGENTPGVGGAGDGNGKILEDSRMDIEKNQQDQRVHWNFPKPKQAAPVVPAEILTEEQKAEQIVKIDDFDTKMETVNAECSKIEGKFDKRISRLKRYTIKMFETIKKKDEEIYVKLFTEMELSDEKWDTLRLEDKFYEMQVRMEKLFQITKVRLTGLLSQHDQKVFFCP